MKYGLYNGSFNVIYKGMNQKVKMELLSSEEKQNNLLTNEYKILTINNKTNCIEEYKIDLIELKNELQKLKEINDKIWTYLTNRF